MYCRKCGSLNDDNAYKCVRCADVLQDSAPRQIDNNLTLAILVTVFCCLPFGIAAIVQAAQVNGKVQAGDYAGAEESARNAKKWSMWALGIGVTFWVVYALLGVLGAALS